MTRRLRAGVLGAVLAASARGRVLADNAAGEPAPASVQHRDRAVAAGSRVDQPLQDMFWGDRYGKLKDPFGHKWSIATHTKDLSMDEMKSGMDEAMEKMQKTA